ncbi:Folylpolyglutamate synthase [Aspergillus sclerotialis]|uniref:Folylpolyglutamate synthase n=1 Tax=Aspergillus sclerotialis TaxID=2070753 RepID=A0A3A2ZAL1_9EURO|nr:Folylpolyglutamate synthase [Aspergillus sclerotialis]
MRTIQTRIQELGIESVFTLPDVLDSQPPALTKVFRSLDLQPHQRTNMRCAVLGLQLAMPEIRPELQVDSLIPELSKVEWPGRLQNIVLEPLVSRRKPILLDGAHNPQSAEVLRQYVDDKLRPSNNSVTWVISASRGKDLGGLFGKLIRPGDNVATTSFGPVDGMPWVTATDAMELATSVRSIPGIGQVKEFEGNLHAAINWGSDVARNGPLVVAGSLYLVSDVFRLLRETGERDNEREEEVAKSTASNEGD